MKCSNSFLPLLILAFSFLQSCTKSVGVVEVTYIKATGVYGDIEALRASPLVEAPRNIVNPGKIFISEDLLLIGEENEGIHVIDDSNPADPIPLSFLKIP